LIIFPACIQQEASTVEVDLYICRHGGSCSSVSMAELLRSKQQSSGSPDSI